MKKYFLAFSFCAVFVFLFSLVLAAIQLNPGTTTFAYQPIFLFNVTDVTGTNPLGVDASVDKLRIFWDAYFCNKFEKGTCTQTVDRSIGVRCYFNCLLGKGDKIDVKCATKQKCEFTGFGPASCTISSPQYLGKTQSNSKPVNNASCKFYDPNFPLIEFIPYPNRSFYLVSFDSKVSSASTTVGEELVLPVKTTNLGLLEDSYNVKMKALNNPEMVSISTPSVNTEKITYGKTAVVDEKLRMLYTATVRFEIMSKSGIEPTSNFDNSCTADADCSHLTNGVCRCPNLEDSCPSKRCWIRNEVEITAKDASLPEFGLFGFLQIIALAAVILFLKKL